MAFVFAVFRIGILDTRVFDLETLFFKVLISILVLNFIVLVLVLMSI